jgi:hypothetical protein
MIIQLSGVELYIRLNSGHYLVKMGYLEEVNSIFLVVGHMKNCCDPMFNLLKIQYRKSNIYGMEDLIKVLGINKKVTVLEVGDEDFKDFNKYLIDFYKTYPTPHFQDFYIFSCRSDIQNCSKVMVKLQKSNADGDSEAKEFDMLKASFFGRERYPAGNVGFQEAIKARPALMGEDSYSIRILYPQGILDYKQVKLYSNYWKYLPEKYKDLTCPKPAESVLATIKTERAQRAKGKKKKKDEKEKVLNKDK